MIAKYKDYSLSEPINDSVIDDEEIGYILQQNSD